MSLRSMFTENMSDITNSMFDTIRYMLLGTNALASPSWSHKIL